MGFHPKPRKGTHPLDPFYYWRKGYAPSPQTPLWRFGGGGTGLRPTSKASPCPFSSRQLFHSRTHRRDPFHSPATPRARTRTSPRCRFFYFFRMKKMPKCTSETSSFFANKNNSNMQKISLAFFLGFFGISLCNNLLFVQKIFSQIYKRFLLLFVSF